MKLMVLNDGNILIPKEISVRLGWHIDKELKLEVNADEVIIRANVLEKQAERRSPTETQYGVGAIVAALLVAAMVLFI